MFDPKRSEDKMAKIVTFAQGTAYITLKSPQSLKPSDFIVQKGCLFQFRCFKHNQVMVVPVQTVEIDDQ